MIATRHIADAIRAAVEGGSFVAVRLERENPEVTFAAGLSNFINSLLEHDPSIRLRDVAAVMRQYAQERQKAAMH